MIATDPLEDENSDVDDVSIRGIRAIADIYERCNLATLKQNCYVEATTDVGWRVAMQKEMQMFDKNST